MSRPDTPDRARRYGQCDDTCTVDCGHCKGAGRPEPVSSAVDGQAVETPTISDRGFKHFDPITAWPDGYRGQVRVYESSAASHPCIWIAVEGNEHVHLTVEDAERLRDQIGYLIEHHYQLDSLPVVPPSARVDGETDELMLPPNPFGTSATWGDYDWYEIAGDVLHGKPYAETVAHKVLRLIADTLAGESS